MGQALETDWAAVRRTRMDGGPDAAGGSRRETVAGKGIIALCRGWLYRGGQARATGCRGSGRGRANEGAWESKACEVFWKGIWICIWRRVNG